MSRQIVFKRYARRFRQPLRTARGEWALREGFIVRVEAGGRVGYGEVAPLPEFGSETLAEAAAFLRQLADQPELPVPPELPCCAFARSAAESAAKWGTPFNQSEPVAEQGTRFDRPAGASATEDAPRPRDYAVSALLPAGAAALRIASGKTAAGYRSLKWKIGVEPVAEEIAMARRLIESLPAGVGVRFDANASLSATDFETWLDLLRLYPGQVDYLEQPLACGEEAAMARRMEATGVAIALDESLNGTAGRRWLAPGAWPGPLVIKAPLMGDLAELAAALRPVAAQVVLSSVFETGIGLENSLRLADALPGLVRPVGFDTLDAFDDGLMPMKAKPKICAVDRLSYNPEQIWNSI